MKINSDNKSYFLILTLIVVTGLVSWNLHFKDYFQKDTVNIHLFPKEINGWTSVELEITDVEYAILETRNAFARKYTSPAGQIVYLLLVYSQNNRKVSHPPEVCYTGIGAEILKNEHAVIAMDDSPLEINTNRLVIERRDIKQVAVYWFKIGDTFTPSYWTQQLLIAVKTLLGKPVSTALVRVSATVDKDIENGEDAAASLITEFTKMIVPDISKYAP